MRTIRVRNKIGNIHNLGRKDIEGIVESEFKALIDKRKIAHDIEDEVLRNFVLDLLKK